MYETGEKVVVKKNLKEGSGYLKFVNGAMMKARGKEFTISNKVMGKDVVLYYEFEEDEDKWHWTEDMFDKVEKTSEIENNEIYRVSNHYPNFTGELVISKNVNGNEWFEFVEDGGGHNGPGISECTKGYCWYFNKDDLEKADLEKAKVIDKSYLYTGLDYDFFKNKKIASLYNLYKLVGNVKKNEIVEVIYRDKDDFAFVRKKGKNGYKYSAINLNGLQFLENNENEEEREKEKVENNVTKEDLESLTKAIKDLGNKVKEQDPLKEAMIEAIIDKGKDLATKELEEELKEKLDEFIEEKYGVLPKIIKLENNEAKKEMKGLFHKEFDKICKLVNANIPLMLVGGAGAGKNYTLEQVAEALDLDFYTTNAINQEYKLTGFIDANGIYHETEFYKAFTKGGMFFLDEVDASCPEALIILNGAIANKYFDFPTGRVTANEKFRVVCAGNTYGTGADMVYVGRNVLDGATLDRFVVLQFDYDEDVEKQLAYDDDLFKFIRALRQAIDKSGLRYIVSMRALINATKMLEIGIDKKTILKTAIVKNMQKDDINTIVKKIGYHSSWVDELKELSDIDD